jgi:hypothetical protein
MGTRWMRRSSEPPVQKHNHGDLPRPAATTVRSVTWLEVSAAVEKSAWLTRFCPTRAEIAQEKRDVQYRADPVHQNIRPKKHRERQFP